MGQVRLEMGAYIRMTNPIETATYFREDIQPLFAVIVR